MFLAHHAYVVHPPPPQGFPHGLGIYRLPLSEELTLSIPTSLFVCLNYPLAHTFPGLRELCCSRDPAGGESVGPLCLKRGVLCAFILLSLITVECVDFPVHTQHRGIENTLSSQHLNRLYNTVLLFSFS